MSGEIDFIQAHINIGALLIREAFGGGGCLSYTYSFVPKYLDDCGLFHSLQFVKNTSRRFNGLHR